MAQLSYSLFLVSLCVIAWCALLAGGEQYSFENTTCPYCQNRDQVSVGNSVTPTYNGCGPSGFEDLVPEYRFHNCCDWHDICYDTCGQVKENCDRGLFVCMLKACDEDYANSSRQLAQCRDLANCYASSVTSLEEVACPAFTDSQQQDACVCVDNSDGNWTSYLPPPIETEYQGINVIANCDITALLESFLEGSAPRGVVSGVVVMAMLVVAML